MSRESLESLRSPESESLLRLLRAAREKRGISQRKLAIMLGWPQPRVWQIEAGVRRLDVVEFMRIAAAIGASPSAILQEVETSISSKGTPSAGK